MRGLEAEDEADVPRVVPAIQMLGLGEVGVAPHGDLAKPGLAAQRDRLVEIDVGLLVGGTVTAAIDQIERLGGVGQRDHQGLITPVAVVVDVDALLALGIGRDHGAVGVEESFLEELVGLLGPDAEAGPLMMSIKVTTSASEAAAEITLGGGVGNSLGSQGVEIDLVVAPQFEVFDPLAAGDDVESDVQDMVGFVVGQMSFEKVEIPIDIRRSGRSFEPAGKWRRCRRH